MKLRIEKRREHAMKFFTPELYLQFNSTDKETADRADQVWEKAIKDYHSHLDTLRAEMPAGVKEFAEKLCLHDADFIGFQEEVHEPRHAFYSPVTPVAILSLKHADELVVLVYALWDKTRHSHRPKGWPFSDQQPHWLYDEIDLDKSFPRLFWHRILLSDGKVIQIPLLDVFIHRVEFQAAKATGIARKGA